MANKNNGGKSQKPAGGHFVNVGGGRKMFVPDTPTVMPPSYHRAQRQTGNSGKVKEE